MTALPIEPLEQRRLLSFAPVQLGSKGYEVGQETAMDAQGDVVVTGIFQHTIKLGLDSGHSVVKLTAAGDTDIFIAKYAPDGSVLWAGQFSGDAKSKLKRDLPIDPARDASFINVVGLQPNTLGQYVNGLTLDASGNVFLTGTFERTVDFDPGAGHFMLTANSKYHLYDAFLVKLNSDGQLVWADSFGGQFNDVGNAVAIDPQGNPVVTGYFTRAADFDPGPATVNVNVEGRDDVFIAKYTAAKGKFMWVDHFGSDTTRTADRESGNGLTVDSTGNIYVTGTFAGTADFDPGPSVYLLKASKQTDQFILELSPKGKRVLAEAINGKGFGGGAKIAVRNGQIYTVGYFNDQVDADPGTGVQDFTSDGDDRHTDLLISKYSSTGALLWARQIGGVGFETIGGFGVAADGSIYTSGGFYDAVDFDPGPGTHTLTSTLGDDNFKDVNDDGRDFSYDIYVSRLSTNGKFIAATRIGAAGDDFAAGLSISPDASTIALTGQFRNTVAFNSDAGTFKRKSVGVQDAFLMELSDDLKLLS